MGAPTDSALDLDEQISQLMQCKPLSEQQAKKLASQYQKEADKCNLGMETCKEVREKAEEALSAQMKLTAMWEIRARQKGWREKVAKSNAFPYFI
ncbi:hypothetical protein PVK06_040571 [Gossypium arboreum]|uniref:Uncharacterized protein n=1 Tax=Gossypium arboreum TaxID=29729 RepID=A0ABR0N5V5_GOSAR|nr:hypothetical protein PVK06_040571 [Gossypium arboreum]